jgi:hypothetical protein
MMEPIIKTCYMKSRVYSEMVALGLIVLITRGSGDQSTIHHLPYLVCILLGEVSVDEARINGNEQRKIQGRLRGAKLGAEQVGTP